MLARIHVNQHNIRANIKGATLPVITVKAGKSNLYGNRVDVLNGDGNIVATVVYSPEKPLSCGAKVWIETSQPILIDGQPLCKLT
jgi:uncharacterized protein YbbC (DUF1343 family)